MGNDTTYTRMIAEEAIQWEQANWRITKALPGSSRFGHDLASRAVAVRRVRVRCRADRRGLVDAFAAVSAAKVLAPGR